MEMLIGRCALAVIVHRLGSPSHPVSLPNVGYHHAKADGQKENQFSGSTTGFVPIAKPLIQDIYDKHYDISSSERNANHLHHHQQVCFNYCALLFLSIKALAGSNLNSIINRPIFSQLH